MDQKGFRKHIEGVSIDLFSEFFFCPPNFAQLRTPKRTGGVLNNFGETAHN